MGKMPKTALLGRFWFAIKTIRQRESDMGRNERDIYIKTSARCLTEMTFCKVRGVQKKTCTYLAFYFAYLLRL
ncbi:MAG: hypothetical protein COZ99_00745 [Parcubacteria group bacterium CG_4_8_14_3_um_filter_48_16]|nr:MAG: hypothetical protein COZ99_00745 [Parcubacteria group bacterium CG_4_8_14_3_um_filter_48_16]